LWRWLLCTLLVSGALSSQCLAEVNVRVQVRGVTGEQLSNVRAFLSIEQRKSEESMTASWLQLLHQDAPAEIRAALEPFGYYNVRVKDSLKQTNGRWIARYEITPDAPVLVTTVDLLYSGEGAENSALATAMQAFALHSGETLDHLVYEDAKASLIYAAQNEGYVKATASDARVEVDPQANTAKITLHIDTGPRFYYGNVSFEQDFLKNELLEKTVTLKPGDPYVIDDVIAYQQGLQVSDWASVVTVDPRFKQVENGRVPIDISMQPSKRNRYSFGFGYETDVGPRVSARWVHRRLNRAGHHSEVYTRLSPVRRTLRGAYYVPIRQPLTDRLASSAHYEYEETSDTRRDTRGAEFAFNRRSLDDRKFSKAFLEYRNEDFQVRGDPTETTQLLSIGFARRYTELGFEQFPQRGRHLEYELRGASSAIASDTSYARLEIGGRHLLRMGDNGRFRLNGQIGRAAVEYFEKKPNKLRKFSGGDTTIRGFDYKSLGPEDENGNVVGGKNMLVLGGEYNHRVKRHWVVAGFVDGGNAFNDTLDDINVGAGVGFRWLMDFGSVRVDLAWPVSNEDLGYEDVIFHLGFGAAL
jgi:translocation and assembly module TamA